MDESAKPNDAKRRLKAGIAGILASLLMLGSAYFSYQSNVKSTLAANLRDGTTLDPGLPFNVILRVIMAVIFGYVSVTLLSQNRQDKNKME